MITERDNVPENTVAIVGEDEDPIDPKDDPEDRTDITEILELENPWIEIAKFVENFELDDANEAEFTFTIEALKGIEVNMIDQNGEETTLTDGVITLKHGESVKIEVAPVRNYTIVESNIGATDPWNTTWTAETNAEGMLTFVDLADEKQAAVEVAADADGDDEIVVNVTNTRDVYGDEEDSLNLTKLWKDGNGDIDEAELIPNEITVKLQRMVGEAIDESFEEFVVLTKAERESEENKAVWAYTFDKVETYPVATANGEAYTYFISEIVNDAAVADGETAELTNGYTYMVEYGKATVTVTDTDKTFEITNTLKANEEVDTGKLTEIVNAHNGDEVPYTVSRTSHLNKDSVATAVDVLPEGVKYVAGSAKVEVHYGEATDNGIAAEPTVTADADNADKLTLTWTDIQVPPMATVTVTYKVKITAKALAAANGELTNYAAISFKNEDGDNPDPDDPADETIFVPDLKIVKVITEPAISEDGRYIVQTGDKVAYTITVMNTGKGEATNVVVKDELPATGLSEIVATFGDETYAADENNEIVITIPTLAAENGVAVITVEAIVTSVKDDIPANTVTITDEDDDHLVPPPVDPDLEDETPEIELENPWIEITKVVDNHILTDADDAVFTFTVDQLIGETVNIVKPDGTEATLTGGEFSLMNGETIALEVAPDRLYTITEADIGDNDPWNTTWMASANSMDMLFEGTDDEKTATVDIAKDADLNDLMTITVTNERKLINEEDDDDDNDGKLTVQKIWKEINGQQLNDLLPQSLTIRLYRESAGEALAQVGGDVNLVKADDWKHTFDTLPATDMHGNTYTYTVVEVATGAEVTTGGIAEIGGQKYDVTITETSTIDGYTIENMLKDQPNDPTEKTADVVEKEGLEAEIGDTIVYTIERKSSFARTTTAKVIDLLPEGLIYNGTMSVLVNGADADYTFDEPSMTWMIENVPPMGTVTVTFAAVVTEDAMKVDELTNTASVNLSTTQTLRRTATTTRSLKR